MTPEISGIQECVEGYIFHGQPARLLIFRRPPDRANYWVPVSGKVETTDSNFEAAIRREIREETGIAQLRRLFPMNWEVSFDGPDGRVWRLRAFGAELDAELRPTLSPEHVEYEWVDFTEAVARLHYLDNRNAVIRLVELVGPTASSQESKA